MDCENKRLKAINAELLEVLENLLDNAVILSREYLKSFEDYAEPSIIQGWDKARWLRAADAADQARAAIKKATD